MYLSILLLTLSQNNLQNDINAAIVGNAKNGTRLVLSGTYVLTETLKIPSNYGLIVDGQSLGQTTILWRGPADSNIIEMSGCHNISLRNMTILSETNCKDMIYVKRTAGDKYISTSCVFENLFLGNNILRCDTCINIENRETDANNDLHKFYRVRFTGYKKQAWHVWGGQIHGLAFEDCDMFGSHSAANGGVAEYGCYFHWLRGSGGYHTNADFVLGKFQTLVSIKGWNSESSAALLHSTKQDWNPSPILVEACRFDGHTSTNGYTITMLHPGPLVLRNNTFTSQNAVFPKILATGLSGHKSGQIVCQGNAIYSNGNYDTNNKFINANADFTVNHEANTFFNFVSSLPSQGDQAELTNGYPVASLTQDGIITRKSQTLTANKHFINEYNNLSGISIQGIHPDGRVKLKATSDDSGIVFWNRNNRITFDPKIWLELPDKTEVYGQASFGMKTGQSAQASGTNLLKIEAEHANSINSAINVYTVRYASAGYPKLTFTAPRHEWYVNGGVWPQAAKSGELAMFVDWEGLHLGSVLLKGTPDGDLIVKSPKLGELVLSQIIP